MPWESSSQLLGTPPGLPHNRLQDLTPALDVGEITRLQPVDDTINGEPAARWARKQLELETPRVEVWRAEARKAEAFEAGDQVSEVDLRELEDAGRPVVTLNAVKRFIAIVNGIERRVPVSVFFLPRDPSDVMAASKAELRTKVKEWIYERCEAGFELARAKKDALITGMGWTESYVSRSDDPAGLVQIQRFNGKEALWSRTSRENLVSTRWRARERDMPVESAIEKWPSSADILIAAGGGEGAPKDYPIPADMVKYVVPWTMTEPTNKGKSVTGATDEVRITDFQYAKPTKGFYFKDPVLEKYQWLPARPMPGYTSFPAYQSRLRDWDLLPKNVEPVTKDTFWRMFLLNRSYLLEGPKPSPIKDDFTLNCITCDWDEKRKIWYGLIRLFKDPQLLIDKLASSIVEIIGASPKSGIIYETGAMSETQVEDYKQNGSYPGAINQVKRNALAEKRVQFKPSPETPNGTVAMLEFALKSLGPISGIEDSILNPQPGSGVGLRQRLSVGLLILAAYLDSSIRFERQQGRITQKFMSLIADDRWVRIGGPQSAQFVQMAKEDFEDEYDTMIDDTEQDPSLRSMYEERVMAIAPTLIRMNQFIPELLDWFKLPVTFREKLKQAIQQKGQMEMQMRERGMSPGGRGKQRSSQEIEADVLKVKGQGMLNIAKARHLDAQSREIGANRMHSDLRGILESLVESHKQSLERDRLALDQKNARMENIRGMADMLSSFRQPGA